MVAMAVSGVFTYSGSHVALLIGYELGVLAASTFAPAAGAFVNELFPTSVRASVAGWNIAASVLGAVLARDTELLGRKRLAPFRVRFGDLARLAFLSLAGLAHRLVTSAFSECTALYSIGMAIP